MLNAAIGETIETEITSPEIEGYTPDQETVEIIATEDLTVTVTYIADEQDADAVEEKEVTSVTLSRSVGATRITVSFDSDAFESEVSLRVTDASSSSAVKAAVEEAAANDASLDKENYAAYDISFINDEDNEVEPKKTVAVTIVANGSDTPNDIKAVLHLDDNDNAETVSADTSGKVANFDTGSFSVYVIIDGKSTNTSFISSDSVNLYSTSKRNSFTLEDLKLLGQADVVFNRASANSNSASPFLRDYEGYKAYYYNKTRSRFERVNNWTVNGATITANNTITFTGNVSAFYWIKYEANLSRTIRYNNNGGTGTAESYTVDLSEKPLHTDYVTLHDGDGFSNNGAKLVGWSKERTNPDVVHYYGFDNQIYPLGGEFVLDESSAAETTLYAVWAPKTDKKHLVIAIRTDGKIPDEPGRNDDAAYVYLRTSANGKVNIEEYLYPVITTKNPDEKDALTKKFYDFVDSRIASALQEKGKNYNPETQTVKWYIAKNQDNDEWHIDGTIIDLAKVKLVYRSAINPYIGNVPYGGQYVKGTSVTVEGGYNNFSVTGYTFKEWNTASDGSGTSYKVGDHITLNEDTILYAIWERNTDTRYIVEHYQQNLSGQNYTLKETEYKTGTTDAEVTATPKTYIGFTFDGTIAGTVKKGTIKADGSLVLKLYYVRNKYKVTYEYTGTAPDGATTLPPTATYKYGASVTVAPAATAQGYAFSGWSKSGTFKMPAEDVVISGSFTAKRDTTYKVEHYQEKLDGTFELKETENLKGVTDTTATANPKSYEGFTFDKKIDGTVMTGTIAADGSLVLKLYYVRNEYKVTYEYIGTVPEGASALLAEATYKYGASVKVADPATAPGYTFSGWNKEDFTMPAEDVVITGSFTANGNTTYKVEHYQEQLNGSFVLKETENLSGETGTKATANPKSYEGFTYDEDNNANVKSGTIKGDGSLVLKLYYVRNKYKVMYEYTGTAPDGATTLPPTATYKYGASVTVAPAATAQGYAFSGWSKSGTFKMPAEDVTITGSFTANTNTAYKVEHYQEKLDGTFELKETENLMGVTDTTATANPKSYEGFTFDGEIAGTMQTGIIKGDGSLVLKLYYVRNKYTVTYTDGVEGEEVFVDQVTKDLIYGTNTPAFNGTPTRTGYTFDGWKPVVAATVNENATYVAQWKKNLNFAVSNGYDAKVYGNPDPAAIVVEASGLLDGHSLANADQVATRDKATSVKYGETDYDDYWTKAEVVGKYDVIIDGTQIVIKDGHGNNVTDQYNIPDSMVIKNGFEITPRNLTITIHDQEVALANVGSLSIPPHYTVSNDLVGDFEGDGGQDKLVEAAMSFIINNDVAITSAGTYVDALDASILDLQAVINRNPDVGKCYNITIIPGTLTVTAPEDSVVTEEPEDPTDPTPDPTEPTPTPDPAPTPAGGGDPAPADPAPAPAPAPAAGDPAAVLGARRGEEVQIMDGDQAAVLGARRGARTGDDSMILIYLFILLATVCVIADRYTTARRMKQHKR